MKLVTSGQLEAKIRARKRVENPDIEKRTLPILTPKIPGNNIKTGTIFTIGSNELQVQYKNKCYNHLDDVSKLAGHAINLVGCYVESSLVLADPFSGYRLESISAPSLSSFLGSTQESSVFKT